MCSQALARSRPTSPVVSPWPPAKSPTGRPRQAALPLAHDLANEGAGPVERDLHLHLDLAHLLSPSRGSSVGSGPRARAARSVRLVTEMKDQLGLERRLQHELRQPRRETAQADQTHPTRPGLGQSTGGPIHSRLGGLREPPGRLAPSLTVAPLLDGRVSRPMASTVEQRSRSAVNPRPASPSSGFVALRVSGGRRQRRHCRHCP